MASMSGTIKRLVSDKGFGFIAASDGAEYFFHQSACSGVAFDDLREGQALRARPRGWGCPPPRFARSWRSARLGAGRVPSPLPGRGFLPPSVVTPPFFPPSLMSRPAAAASPPVFFPSPSPPPGRLLRAWVGFLPGAGAARSRSKRARDPRDPGVRMSNSRKQNFWMTLLMALWPRHEAADLGAVSPRWLAEYRQGHGW